jgi:VWFA-related protein
VNQLGPDDLGAVVSTSNGPTQNLTSDRGRLLRAINVPDLSTDMSAEALAIMNLGPVQLKPLNDGRCLCGLCVLETITRVADAVQSTPRRRKVLFFIGSDLVLQSPGSEMGPDLQCGTPLKDARTAMFAAIDRANLTIHSLDPSGLATVPIAQAARAAPVFNSRERLERQGAIKVLPDRTGGRTVTNANDPDLSVDDIFLESDSYYLIGFRPADPAANGKFHAISVKANRRGLDVHARSGHTAPLARAPDASPSPPDASLSEPVRAALTGLLPSNGVPVDLSATTFANSGSEKGMVILSMGVGAFAALPAGTASAPQGMTLEVVAGAFDRGGRAVGTTRQTVELSQAAAASARNSRLDVLSRLDLAAGEYEIRVAVAGTEPPRTASVFAYVTVPPFDDAPLSLSSIVVGATAGTLTAPRDFLGTLLPIAPTARRDFSRADKAVAFLRIYQGTRRQDPLQPVQLRASLIDVQGRIIASDSSAIDVVRFANERTADHYFALPLATLAAGEYLLRIETDMGERSAGRVLRFSVR